MGTVLLAHPLRLRAMVVRRSKSDRLDAQLLAQLLRLDQIPLAYVPPAEYQMLRDLVRYRAQLGRQVAQVKTQLRQAIARQNIQPPYKYPFGPRGLYWFSRQDLGPVGNQMRDHLLERLAQASAQLSAVDAQLHELRPQFPEVEALMDLRGVGLFTALMVVAEFGDVERFHTAKQAAAYMHRRQQQRKRCTRTLRRAAERMKRRPANASDEAKACIAIMSGRSSSLNVSMCDGFAGRHGWVPMIRIMIVPRA